MPPPVRIAVAGAGLIGRRHAEVIEQVENVQVAAIVDPTNAARNFAEGLGARWFPALDDLFAAGDVDGVILALPNQVHAEAGMACVAAGLPTLVEKPFTHNVTEGEALVSAAKTAGVALLTGHHRRHNPLIQKALEIVNSGLLGKLTAVQGQAWFMKPDCYFETEWRRRAGGGPVYINLIHDIELLQAFCGRVISVHAMESNAVRGYEVEETAVILLRFASGLLGTVNVCDAAASPWSWELTARENPAYPTTAENCYWIAGTKGSIALPNLALWRHEGEQSWWNPINTTRMAYEFENPLVRQIRQFAAVIRGHEQPLVSGVDGLAALKVIEAIKTSSTTGQTIEVTL